MSSILFKTDENVHPDGAELLRSLGHDAMTVWDQSLRGTDDPNLAAVCRREGRVLVTFDADFCDIRTYPPAEYPGIIALRTTDQSRHAVLATLRRIATALESHTIAHSLWIVDDSRIRRRTGP